jgi:DNA gyrase subunit A
MSTLKAPDFPTGGELIYNGSEIDAIYRTGRGGFKVRARWRYNKQENLIEVYEIPYTTTAEAIIDKVAELVAEIKLRNINREYILKRIDETSALEEEIKDLEDTLQSSRRIKAIIVDELKAVIKKYGAERKTGIVYDDEVELPGEEEQIEDYAVNIFLSREGYFKKITPLSLRMGGEHKYKENDGPYLSFESQNRNDLLIFTDKQQVYKVRVRDFEDTKASVLGTYLPTYLQMDEGESVKYILDPGDYSGHVVFFFENGKAARIELGTYATKTNRKKLTGAYSGASPLVSVIQLNGETELAVYSSEGRVIIFSTSLLAPKTTRTTLGVAVMTMKKKYRLVKAVPVLESSIKNTSRYRMRSIPTAGALLKEEDLEEKQLEMSFE